MLALFAVLGAVYLIGAIPFGYLIGRLVKGVDIRNFGSGNIGATNVGRVLGWKWFPVVMLLDLLKGAAPVFLIRYSSLPVDELLLNRSVLASLAGLVAMLGHLFPVYLHFKGGKGVATGAGVIGVLLPLPTLIAAAAFVFVLTLTRYVSLSSIVGAVTLVVAVFVLDGLGNRSLSDPTSGAWAPALLAVLGAILVVGRHRANIARLLEGTEPKIGRQTQPIAQPPDSNTNSSKG